MTQQQPSGDEAADDRRVREGYIVSVLRCLRAAAPGVVTTRYLHSVTGYDPGTTRQAIMDLRIAAVPVITHRMLGYSLPNEWRDVEGSSLTAALAVSNSVPGALHDPKLNGDAK